MLDMLDVRSGGRVLDAGCGMGTALIALRQRAGSAGVVVGLDRSGQMLASRIGIR